MSETQKSRTKSGLWKPLESRIRACLNPKRFLKHWLTALVTVSESAKEVFIFVASSKLMFLVFARIFDLCFIRSTSAFPPCRSWTYYSKQKQGVLHKPIHLASLLLTPSLTHSFLHVSVYFLNIFKHILPEERSSSSILLLLFFLFIRRWIITMLHRFCFSFGLTTTTTSSFSFAPSTSSVTTIFVSLQTLKKNLHKLLKH